MTARRQPNEAKGLESKSIQTKGRDLPLFAQPLNGSKFPAATSTTGSLGLTLWKRPSVWGLAVITCGVLLAIALPNKAQNVPASQGNAPASRTSGTNSRSVQIAQGRTTPATSTPTLDTSGEAREESRRSVDFYTQTVRGNLFNAPQLPAPPVAPKPMQPKPPKSEPPIKVPVVEINPFEDWSYTGTMTSDNQTTALIENTKTKEGQFVKAGDMFMGSQIASITDQAIVLQAGQKTHMLAKSDNITVTPLDRSAIPSAGAQPQSQANAQQPVQVQIDMSAMQQAFGNRGGFGRGGNGQNFSLPNGRTFNPQQWQQRTQRMNRGFNQ